MPEVVALLCSIGHRLPYGAMSEMSDPALSFVGPSGCAGSVPRAGHCGVRHYGRAIKKWMHPAADLAGYEPLFEGLRLAGVSD